MPVSVTRRSAKPVALLALSAALIVPLAACSSEATTSDEPQTLRYASGDAEPTCLDPHVGGNWPQAILANQFLESLFSKNDAGEIVPWLATGAESADDQLSWTIGLKEGVTFTDGTPFDAEAVVANVEHIKNPDTASSTAILALGKVSEAVAVDEHTVRLDLSEPDSALLESLAQTWLAIESPAGLERGTDENCLAPIGTGAFKVEAWDKQSQVVLTRNENHTTAPEDGVTTEGQPGAAVGTIEWKFIPDAATRLAALQSGQADIIDSVQPDALAQFQSNGTEETLIGARPGVTARIELNTTRAPFDDPKVREAFAASADIDAAVESLYFGTLERSTSVLSSATPFATSHPDAFGFDAARASALLDEAGWTQRDADGVRTKNGERLEVAFPVSTNQSIPVEISVLEQIKATSAEVGFDVQLELLDLSTWYERSGTWEFDAIVAPYSKNSADVLRIVYSTDSITPAPSGYHANNTGLSLPALDEALEAAVKTTDEAERERLYGEAQQLIIDSGTVIPLYDQTVQFAHGDNVHGFRLQPNVNVPSLVNVTIE